MTKRTNFGVIQIGGCSCVSWLVRVKILDFSTKRLFSGDLLKKQCALQKSDVSGLKLRFWSPR